MEMDAKLHEFKESYDDLIGIFKEHSTKKISENKIIVESTSQWNYGIIHNLFLDQKNDIGGCEFFITSIKKIKDVGEAPPIVSTISLDKKRGSEDIVINHVQGLFKVEFSDGSFMMFSSWGRIKNDFHVESLFACEKQTWIKFLRMFEEQDKKRVKVPIGEVYKYGIQENKYVKRDVRQTPVIHPTVSKVTEDLEYFFDNMEDFTRYNMPGVRKVMLIGPPGTGKTSLLLRIADKYKKQHNVCFFTDIGSLSKHLNSCSQQNVSTICFLEDAETSLNGAGSSILNMLDGVDQPIVKKGAYVVMTTNFPKRIEARILQRPGRVDQIFPFDLLKGDVAMECAKLYMNESLFGKKKVVDATPKQVATALEDILDVHSKGVSGTRIKQFSEDVLRYVVSHRKKKITLDELREIFDLAEKNIKDVYKMAQENGLMDDSAAFSWDDDGPVKTEEFKEDYRM